MSDFGSPREEPADYASYLIKTFGARISDCTFSRLPAVIARAKAAIPDLEIVGFLACAIERPPRLTGLMFCDHRHQFPQGLPARTPAIRSRYWKEGYEVVVACTGGLYVIAHWWHENGAIGPFNQVH
jgi:hypothetical protein